MSDKDWLTLIDNLEHPRSPEEMATDIAKVLMAGTPSKMFCAMLAGMIDPSPNVKNCLPHVLRIKRAKAGQPKDSNWWRLAIEMERLVDINEVPTKQAIFECQEQFGKKGNERSKCLEALAEARNHRKLCAMVDAAAKRPKY